MTRPDVDRVSLLARLFAGQPVPPGLTEDVLRTGEVARIFQVSERTVVEWARRGRIPSVRTPGGHRLYPAAEILHLLETSTGRGADPPVPPPHD